MQTINYVSPCVCLVPGDVGGVVAEEAQQQRHAWLVVVWLMIKEMGETETQQQWQGHAWFVGRFVGWVVVSSKRGPMNRSQPVADNRGFDPIAPASHTGD